MAQVPIINQNQVGVSRTPQEYNKVSADPKAFGDFGWTDVAQKQLKEAEKILQDREDEMLTAQTFEKNNELDDLYTNLLYHPETGFNAKQGKDAAYQAQSVIDNYTKESQKIIDGVGNIRVKNKLNEIQARKERSFAQAAFAHDIEQKRIYHNDLMQSTIKTQTDNGILGRSNPEVITRSIQNIRTAIGIYSGENDPELLKAMQDNAVSGFHLNIINSMLENNELGTKAYFEAHKNEISPTTKGYHDIIHTISVNDIKGRAILESDKLIASGLSIDKQLEAVRKIKDPELRDEVQSRLEHNYSIQERIAADAKQKREERAWDLLEKNPSINNIPSDVDAQTRISMKNYLKSITEEGEVKTNPEAYNYLHNLLVNNPEEFSKTNMLQYKGYLSDSDLKSFIDKQKSPDSIKAEQIKIANTINSEADKLFKDKYNVKKINQSYFGGTLAEKKITGTAGTNKFKAFAQQALDEEISRKGRPLTREEELEFYKTLGKSNIYQDILKNEEKRAGFKKTCYEEFETFKKIHGREPNTTEKQAAINRIKKETLDEARGRIQQMIEDSYKPLKGESQAQNYFANKIVPSISRELGVNYKVTSTYRKGDNGNHGKGLSVDVSMSEHKTEARNKFVGKLINNPDVVRIGTSDPEILKAYKGNAKINNLTAYDKGRPNENSHKNHVHITLSGKSSLVRVQAPDGKIWYIPSDKLDIALRNGAKKL